MNIPFHVATVRKPQDAYGIKPDNSNAPLARRQLPRELTLHSAKDLVDQPMFEKRTLAIEPRSLELTPFTYIDTVEGLKTLRAKLNLVDEFAVDLEANNYRSFQGMTCLMQISTRSEDFVVDTLKLHGSIGSYLGSLFLDPKKRKVMHGAGNDILWLQRDFGIYVCNLFDTMQASRVLKMERNSLAHLLMYFCGVLANKQYQTSDWRIRPLPREMLHYAREDTHYLLYIHDKMRLRLINGSGINEFGNPLLEVYERSHKVCTALYEKELFTEDSYKTLFGLGEANLNSNQFKVVSRLYKWRDAIARENDESTGYVMPNKLLLEISQKLPKSKSELLSLAEQHNCQNHPFIEGNTDEILRIVGNKYAESRVSQIDNPTPKQNAMHQDINYNDRSHMERQYAYAIGGQQGYFVSGVYPQTCYVNVVSPPGYHIPAKHHVLVNPVYCTYPNNYQYQVY